MVFLNPMKICKVFVRFSFLKKGFLAYLTRDPQTKRKPEGSASSYTCIHYHAPLVLDLSNKPYILDQKELNN